MPPGGPGRTFVIGMHPREQASGTVADDDVTVLLDGLIEAVRSSGVDPSAVAVLVGDGDPDLPDAARERGLRPVAIVDADGEDFARHVEAVGADVAAVRVRWQPDDDADVKKERALALTKVAAWLHETGRQLLVEVVTDGGTDVVAETVHEIRGLGTEPDLWAVPSGLDAGQLAELVRDAGRDHVALLEVELDPVPTSTAGPVDGRLVEHAAWIAPAVDELRATHTGTRDQAVSAAAHALAPHLDLSEAAPPA